MTEKRHHHRKEGQKECPPAEGLAIHVQPKDITAHDTTASRCAYYTLFLF